VLSRRVIVFLASGAYLGYAPVASGTFGSLAGVAICPIFELLRRGSPVLYVLTFLGLVAAAIWIADEAERIFAEKDSGKIAIDEVAGFIATMLFVPLSWATLAAGFFLFRLYDVLKLWPASWFDRHGKGGVGVVMDDVFAGLYANLTLRLLFWAAGIPLAT
jgi:phosphatidylglycerophosphatase A